jgi:hypothetical protein
MKRLALSRDDGGRPRFWCALDFYLRRPRGRRGLRSNSSSLLSAARLSLCCSFLAARGFWPVAVFLDREFLYCVAADDLSPADIVEPGEFN